MFGMRVESFLLTIANNIQSMGSEVIVTNPAETTKGQMHAVVRLTHTHTNRQMHTHKQMHKNLNNTQPKWLVRAE